VTTSSRLPLSKVIAGCAVLIAFAVFPILAGDYHSQLMGKFLVFGVLALSLDLMWGYTGVINFSQATFFGVGAYGAALTMKHLVAVPGASYVAVLVAIAAPMLLGAIMGYFLFYGRVSGVYFAIVTLAVGTIFYSLSIVLIDFTGGLNGLYGFPPLKLGIPGIWESALNLGNIYLVYYVVLVAAVLVYLVAHRLVGSPFGRALRAVKSNETRTEFTGYDVAALKMITLAVSGGIAGLAGAMYIPVGVVSPQILGILFSTNVIVWVAVGGRGTLIGPLIGALVVGYLQTFLSETLVSVWLLITGVFFVFVVLFWPDGIVGFAQQRVYPLLRRLGRSAQPRSDTVQT
jgi:urea transport system permease protein